MEEAVVDAQQQLPLEAPRQTIVTSCEEDDSSSDSSAANNEDSSGEEDGDAPNHHHQPDDLFDDQADDEDEAYVYKHLRSGVEETVTTVVTNRNPASGIHTMRSDPNSSNSAQEQPVIQQRRQQLKVLKPRNSDAVLSCPCCFNIVCMDCQQHEYYPNQYRAMFVMGIAVRWDMPLQYSESARALVPTVVNKETTAVRDEQGTTTTKILPSDNNNECASDSHNNSDDVIYYTVCCTNCQTTVAALDMTDEVYHFSGCLASS